MNKFQVLTLSGAFLLGLIGSGPGFAQEQEARDHARAAAVAAAKAEGKAESVTLEEPTRSYFDWGQCSIPTVE